MKDEHYECHRDDWAVTWMALMESFELKTSFDIQRQIIKIVTIVFYFPLLSTPL